MATIVKGDVMWFLCILILPFAVLYALIKDK